jgi:FkbM family methyltransferase
MIFFAISPSSDRARGTAPRNLGLSSGSAWEFNLARHIAARLIERYTGMRVMRVPPPGLDLAFDLARFAPQLDIGAIVDVGANIGQSTIFYGRQYPKAEIHSLEPGAGLFEALVANTRHLPQVTCYKTALGAKAEERTFVLNKTRSHLAEPEEQFDGLEHHTVTVETLQHFVERIGLKRIGMLKIDTEGLDFDVLRGGEALFADAVIDCVQVEAGLNPTNTVHVPLRDMQDWLESRGYYLFGYYEQTHEFNGDPQLRRADVAFISPRIRAMATRRG